jgi:flavin-dependent thymidylate synthase
MDNSVEWAVADDNKGWYGGDITHALSAWTSTSRELTEEKRARIPALLKMLAENEHTTPFEKSYLQFIVVCDTASHIHLLKHRIGVSINAESARYKELKEDKAYIPDDWPNEMIGLLNQWTKTNFGLYHFTYDNLLRNGFDKKRAKESARFFLPYANQLTLDVAFNFNSFIHFQKLRNSSDAQQEIRQIAQKMLYLVEQTGAFKYSLEAYGLKSDA